MLNTPCNEHLRHVVYNKVEISPVLLDSSTVKQKSFKTCEGTEPKPCLLNYRLRSCYNKPRQAQIYLACPGIVC